MGEPSIPPRPDVKPSPQWLTLAALFLTLAAVGMAFPQLVESLSWPADPEFSPPPGWQLDLWVGAIFVGATSFLLAVKRRFGESRPRSPSGRRLATITLVVATVGACVWAFPGCIVAGNGL